MIIDELTAKQIEVEMHNFIKEKEAKIKLLQYLTSLVSKGIKTVEIKNLLPLLTVQE